MRIIRQLPFTFLNTRLFIQKLISLVVATGILIPLVHYKLGIPALLYTSGLLALHIFFFYIYFARTPWQRLLAHKGECTVRLAAVGFFIYILTLIKFEGSSAVIIERLLIAMVVHAFILAGMMLVRREQPRGAAPTDQM